MRHPGGVGDLFSSLSDAEHFGDLAFVGHYDGDAGLAEGFAEAAEAIFFAWQDQEWANDRLLLPIAYNYRHALELALKQAIRDAAECRQLSGDDPGLTAQALEAHFKQKQRHRLGPLAQQLAGMLAELNWASCRRTPRACSGTCTSLTLPESPSGTTGSSRPAPATSMFPGWSSGSVLRSGSFTAAC